MMGEVQTWTQNRRTGGLLVRTGYSAEYSVWPKRGATDDLGTSKSDITRKSHPRFRVAEERFKGFVVAGGYSMVRLSLHRKAAISDSWQASDACASLTWV